MLRAHLHSTQELLHFLERLGREFRALGAANNSQTVVSPTARLCAACAVLAAGGWARGFDNSTGLNTAELYDASARTWKATGSRAQTCS
jgi:glycine/D-amino acid oxidase-like deaminating enzyme